MSGGNHSVNRTKRSSFQRKQVQRAKRARLHPTSLAAEKKVKAVKQRGKTAKLKGVCDSAVSAAAGCTNTKTIAAEKVYIVVGTLSATAADKLKRKAVRVQRRLLVRSLRTLPLVETMDIESIVDQAGQPSLSELISTGSGTLLGL